MEIDGNGACGPRLRSYRQSGRHLQEPLGPNQIGVKLGSQGIAPKGRAVNLSAAFAQQRIVDGHYKGRSRRRLLVNLLDDGGEESVGVEPVFREQSIRGRTILELLARRHE